MVWLGALVSIHNSVWWTLLWVGLLVRVEGASLIYNSTHVQQSSLVRTGSGPVSGLFVVRLGLNVSCYLGIPYAEPPLGERRFADPVPVQPWKTTYRAVRQPPICYQREWRRFRPTDFELVRELMKQDESILDYYVSSKSEDCLYLSVFAVPNGNQNKTVLVWIHGGAFISGTANLPFYDYPLMVARDPNLVVVAINYRLNVFGFVTSGTGQLTGNYGLKDQIMALRWIKSNIGAFGGNSSRVVVWGQSAGAVAIGYHMLTKQSGDQLFSRAILESGNPLLPLTLGRPSYRQKAFNEFVHKLNCSLAESKPPLDQRTIDHKVLPCLRSKSSAQLFDAYKDFAHHSPLAFLPNIRDQSLFHYPSVWQAIRKGDAYSFSGDILIGTNQAEGAQYVKVGPLEKYYSKEKISPNFTRPNILDTLKKFVPKSMGDMMDPVLDLLMDGVQKQDNSTELWNRYVQLVGDMVFVCPDYFFIRSFHNTIVNSHKSKTRPNVYYYRFESRVSKPFDCPHWSTGACHTDELQFVFGNPIVLQSLYPQIEQNLTKSIMATWFDFAHQGKFTSKESFVQWKQLDLKDPEYIRIQLNGGKMVKGFPGERCEELCEPLYDVLESLDDNSMKLIKTK